MPATEQKLFAIPTGKRDGNDQPVYMYFENTCAHAFHAAARREALAGIEQGRMLPQISLTRYNGVRQPAPQPPNNAAAAEEGVAVSSSSDSDGNDADDNDGDDTSPR